MMLTMLPTLTIDDAVIALLASDAAEELAGQELSHSQLTVLVERQGWQPTHTQKFQNMPKGLVSKWLLERDIPLHPRTRRVKFDDLAVAAATPGKLQPTPPRILERRALDAKAKSGERVLTLRSAIVRAERLIAAQERGLALLDEHLERMRGELEAAEAEDQRLYDAGDRTTTVHRLDLDLTMPGSQIGKL